MAARRCRARLVAHANLPVALRRRAPVAVLLACAAGATARRRLPPGVELCAYRAGLAALLRAAPGIEVVGEAADDQPLIADVVLTDIRMPGTDGITATTRIRAAGGPEAPRVLVLTTARSRSPPGCPAAGLSARLGRMSFTEAEIAYLTSQPLARLATLGPDGQPDAVPVAFELDGDVIWVGGTGESVLGTRKMRNVAAGRAKVALVVDDLPSFQPFVARGVRVYGEAEPPVERVGLVGPGHYVRITPTESWSWNLDGEPAGDTWYPSHHTVHATAAD